MARNPRNQRQSGRSSGLTPIAGSIHCAATSEPQEDEEQLSEQDEIDIEHFLDTLAQVALAIAARKLASKPAEGEE